MTGWLIFPNPSIPQQEKLCVLQEDFATGVFPSEIVEQELPVPRVKTSKLERLPRAPEAAELQELLKQRPP